MSTSERYYARTSTEPGSRDVRSAQPVQGLADASGPVEETAPTGERGTVGDGAALAAPSQMPAA